MRRPAFSEPRRALLVWGCLVLLGFGGLRAYDLGVTRYAEARQAANPRHHLAAAAESIEARDFQAARRAINQAMALAPEHPEPHVLLGHLHFRNKQWRPAINAYRRAIELRTHDVSIVQNIVWAQIELGLHDEAVAVGEQALADGLDLPHLARYLAEAQFRAGRQAEALPHLRHALEREPENLYLMDQLRRVYAVMGDEDGAAAMRARISEIEAAILGEGVM